VCPVGTAPPRRCGGATFTDDLLHALTGAAPDRAAVQVALTDDGRSDDYGQDVVFEVRASELQDYRDAAAFVNSGDAARRSPVSANGPAGSSSTRRRRRRPRCGR